MITSFKGFPDPEILPDIFKNMVNTEQFRIFQGLGGNTTTTPTVSQPTTTGTTQAPTAATTPINTTSQVSPDLFQGILRMLGNPMAQNQEWGPRTISDLFSQYGRMFPLPNYNLWAKNYERNQPSYQNQFNPYSYPKSYFDFTNLNGYNRLY